MATKRKRVVLSIDQKVTIINRAVDNGENIKKLSVEFGVGVQTVRDLIKRKSEIFNFISTADTTAAASTRKTMKKSKLSDLDGAVFEWFKQKRAEGVPISGPMVSEKALFFHKNLNINERFSASAGWLEKFKKRHGIRQLEIHGESLSGDLTAATLFNEEFNSLMEKFNLTPEQIYNADESGLFWKMMPSTTLAAQSEKSAPGHKSSKERLTIMTCSNASGAHKIKLTVIGRAKKPRSFKGTEMKSLPCDYYHHPKAWMNQTIFKTWFFDVFIPSVRQYQNEKRLPTKAVLLLDNAPSHPSESQLISEDGQIFVHYLPPNVTSLIQPMDQGVISSLKRRYKKIFLRFLLEENCAGSMKETLKMWTIKDAIFAVSEAWESLPSKTLKLSWSKILEEKEEVEDDFTQENPEENEIDTCLEIAKSIPDFINVNREDITDWLEKDKNEEGYEQLTDSDIVILHGKDMPSQHRDSESDNSDDNLESSEEKIKHLEAIEAVDTLIKFFEQQNSEFNRIISLRNMRTEIRKIMMNSKKQKLISDYCISQCK
jgi:hypothetical protein